MKIRDETRFEKLVESEIRRVVRERHDLLRVMEDELHPDLLHSGVFSSPDMVIEKISDRRKLVVEVVDSVRFESLPYAMLNKMHMIRQALRGEDAEVVLLTSSEVTPPLRELLQELENVSVIQEKDASLAVEKLEEKFLDLEKNIRQ
jgi:hypothetical protein